MKVELRYALTREDLFEFNYFHAWTNPFKKRVQWEAYFRYWIKITLPTLVLAFIFNNGQFNLHAGRSYLVAILIGLLLTLITCQWAMKAGIRKAANLFYEDPMNENFFRVKSYEIGAAGIIVSDDVMVSDIKWEAIVRRAETASAFYLFLNSHQALVIPKNLLFDSQKEDLESILNIHVPFLAEIPAEVIG